MKIRLKKELEIDIDDVLKIANQTYLVVMVNYTRKGTLCHVTSNFNRKHINRKPITIDENDLIK
jgi:hypothetical protein